MPNWKEFQTKHVLNPTVDGDCLLWDKVQWNRWLQNRLPNDFGRKRVNSIVVSAPDAIIKDFENLIYDVCKQQCYEIQTSNKNNPIPVQ